VGDIFKTRPDPAKYGQIMGDINKAIDEIKARLDALEKKGK